MNRPSADWDKLARHVAGELSPAESAEMRKWLDANPAEARAIAEIEKAAKALPPSTPVDVEAALRKVKTRLQPATPWRTYATGLAAAAAVVVAIARFANFSDPAPAASAARTFATAVGARDSVVLADGSRILLGPASRVVVNGRDVELTGEAFFVVAHDEKRPFVVRTGGTVILDIGTEFSVHSDGQDVRVVVREGSVQLGNPKDSVVLTPGDVGVADQGGRVRASRGAATEEDLAWTRGRLVFRNASVTELGADLRRWYGVELRVSDTALLGRHFTGSFVDEPVGRVMDVIALALGARADRRGDTVYIRPRAAVK